MTQLLPLLDRTPEPAAAAAMLYYSLNTNAPGTHAVTVILGRLQRLHDGRQPQKGNLDGHSLITLNARQSVCVGTCMSWILEPVHLFTGALCLLDADNVVVLSTDTMLRRCGQELFHGMDSQLLSR
jgi:hypothetical protein